MKHDTIVATEQTARPLAYVPPELHVTGSAVALTKGADYDEDEEDFTKCIDAATLIEPRN